MKEDLWRFVMSFKLSLLIMIFVIDLFFLVSCPQKNKESAPETSQQASTNSSPSHTTETIRGKHFEVKFTLSGLKSKEDADKLRSEIVLIEGVTAVQVVFKGEKEGGLAFISYDPNKTDVNSIKRAISKLGYRAEAEKN